MILGDVCTRRCPFCDVAHGRPGPVDPTEPEHLAQSIAVLGLSYAVITSVDRDDLRDGGAGHFAACLGAIRRCSPRTRLEVLVPDFRGRESLALDQFRGDGVPDLFNHNLETVPRLPGADYAGSLALLGAFKERNPKVPTKSGLMLGLGEEFDEVLAVMADLRTQGCDMLTLGQYLAPSRSHLPVSRYWTPGDFEALRACARGARPWATPMSPVAPWCGPPTMPTGKPRKPWRISDRRWLLEPRHPGGHLEPP